jgi:hypothetical protein
MENSLKHSKKILAAKHAIQDFQKNVNYFSVALHNSFRETSGLYDVTRVYESTTDISSNSIATSINIDCRYIEISSENNKSVPTITIGDKTFSHVICITDVDNNEEIECDAGIEKLMTFLSEINILTPADAKNMLDTYKNSIACNLNSWC